MEINQPSKLKMRIAQENKYSKMILENIFGKKNNKINRDLFIISDMVSSNPYTYKLPSNKGFITGGMLLSLNNMDYRNGYISGDMVYCDQNKYHISQIPPIDINTLNPIKAQNNIMDFGKNKYFKYVSSDGKEHKLFTPEKKGGINLPYSERLLGEPYDAALQEYAGFWNYLMGTDPVFIGLTYSNKEIRGYLDEAGIKNGFFTVKMGEKESTLYYSEGTVSGILQSKESYDILYNAMVNNNGGFLNVHEPGEVYTIGGKEYIVSENHTLDIPYGEDIYNIIYPKYNKK